MGHWLRHGGVEDVNNFILFSFLKIQLMEELESLEETVNESIRESLGARTGKSMSKKKPVFEDEDEDDRYKTRL